MHAPDVWGAKGPNSFDCSGLVQFAFTAAGRSVPAPAGSQFNNCPNKVPYAQAQPGDFVFFGAGITHAGIYTGNGMMISVLPKGGVQASRVREFLADTSSGQRNPVDMISAGSVASGPRGSTEETIGSLGER
ncbi:NlpC/P60 family protein [Arthrobacter sp. NPDC080031]|uniref:C40 family peptidase n=1 Tax=Arthrobacter sp. NPDC080031 TaxID=3155918 RepID=UPI00344CF5B9